jgi:predicted dithiol-disulfide oxidoreductase (DUF899 family)
MQKFDITNEIQKTQKEIFELTEKLAQLHRDNKPQEIKNYKFNDLQGEVSLLELFGGKKQLIAIHNMGQACRYCTLWADGLNGFLPHLENEMSVVLLSKDDPQLQRQFANSRQWRFRMASHAGADYIKEQSVEPGGANHPGIVIYERNGDKIFKKNSAGFGPGDLYCSIWNVLSLAGRNSEDWTPQYNYWKRPAVMDDGGENLNS